MTKAVRDDILDVCQKTVRLEDAFIDLAFEMGPVPGMTPREIKKYIRYIADWRLGQLGFQPIYMIEDHPLPGSRRCSTVSSTPTSSKPAPPNIPRPRRAGTGARCGTISTGGRRPRRMPRRMMRPRLRDRICSRRAELRRSN